jgi:hypothetical protein
MHLSKPMSKISDSKRTKFKDYLPYIKRIKSGTYLNFDILDLDGKSVHQASEIIGEGISRCLLCELLGIPENSIDNIMGSGVRPDFEARARDGSTIICESKGSFNHVSQHQINRATNIQKVSRSGDLKIAAINDIGNLSRLIDPPVNNDETNRFSPLINKTNHYIQVFRLAGQQEIARYFKLLRKRFENDNRTDFPEFPDKVELWSKLKYETQRKKIDGKEFIGNVEFVEDNKILFIGFDERLLNVNTFELFTNYEDIYTNHSDGSTILISKDGVCFIEADMSKVQELFPNIDISKIKNYQELTWLSDIDDMGELEFSNYLQFVFQEIGVEFEKEKKIDSHFIDYVVNFRGKKYYLELKLFESNNQLTYKENANSISKTSVRRNIIEQTDGAMIDLLPYIDYRYQIIITNKDRRLINTPSEVIVFDRNDLKKLLKNKKYFIDFLSALQ